MLFSTIDQVKTFVAINKSGTDFSTLQPYLLDAEEMVLEYIDDATAAALQTEAGAATDPDMAALLPYVRKPIANYALYLYVEGIGSVSLSDTGIQVSRNQNSEPAPQWKVNKLEKNLLSSGDKAVDRMLAFLEANVATYTDWAASSKFTEQAGCFLKNAKQADEYIPIGESRRVFQRLKGEFQFVEAIEIRNILCDPLFNEIKAQLRGESALTEANAELVALSRPVIALIGLKNGLEKIRMKVTESGVSVSSFSDGLNKHDAATREQLADLKENLMDQAHQYKERLVKYLNDNVATYPLYANSPCYTSRPTTGAVKHEVENSKDGKSYMV